RNLHLYHALGILESTELDGEKHFRMNCMSDHHHHFICKDCGNTKKIPICPMREIEEMLTDYDIEGHKLEVYGVCLYAKARETPSTCSDTHWKFRSDWCCTSGWDHRMVFNGSFISFWDMDH